MPVVIETGSAVTERDTERGRGSEKQGECHAAAVKADPKRMNIMNQLLEDTECKRRHKSPGLRFLFKETVLGFI